MLATLFILAVGGLGLLLSGIAASLAIWPGKYRLGPEVPALGLATLLLVAYPLYQFSAGPIAAPAAVAVVATVAAIGVFRWLRLDPQARRLPRFSTGLVVALTFGSLASIVALAPVLSADFPTTLGFMNWDAWGYAGTVDWLQQHPHSGATPDPSNPVSFPAWSTDSLSFPIGTESVLAMLAWGTGRLGYEVTGIGLALGGLVAVSGWMTIGSALGIRRLGWLAGFAAGIASTSPMLLVTSYQVYANQFLSLCLWPLAVGLALRAFRRPTAGGVVAAGISVAAVMTVYPTMLLWTLPAIAGAAAAAIWSSTDSRRAAKAVGLAMLGIAASVLLLGLLQLVHAVRNLVFVSGKAGNPSFPDLSARTLAEIFVGSWVNYLDAETLGSGVVAASLTVFLGIGIALVARRRSSRLWLPIIAATALPSLVIVLTYTTLSPYPYGAYKATITAGVLVGGLIVMALAMNAGQKSKLARFGLAGIALFWVPQTLTLIESASSNQATGFQKADVEALQELATLPPKSTTLVEGYTEMPAAFRARMLFAYGASTFAKGGVVGLGTTGTYLTPGGDDAWIPTEPWDFIANYGADHFPERGGEPIWSNPFYSLRPAPVVDVTLYGLGWSVGRDPNGQPFAWLSRPGWLLISNRSGIRQRARLSVAVESVGVPRQVTLRAEGEARMRRAPVSRPVRMRLDVSIPARTVTRIRVGAIPSAPAEAVPAGLAPQMLRINEVEIRPV